MLLLKLPLLEKELWQRNLMQLKCSQTFNNKEADAKKQEALAEEAKKN
jgi:hypothetical protein